MLNIVGIQIICVKKYCNHLLSVLHFFTGVGQGCAWVSIPAQLQWLPSSSMSSYQIFLPTQQALPALVKGWLLLVIFIKDEIFHFNCQ
jgi:hypothetical protein